MFTFAKIAMSKAVSILHQAQILTQANLNIVTAHIQPANMARVLSSLKQAQILTDANRDLAATHPEAYNLFKMLHILQQAQILTQAHFEILIAHYEPYNLFKMLDILQQAQILTQANFNIVATHANLFCLFEAFFILSKARILTNANFTALLASNHASLITEEAGQNVWARIPYHLLTTVNYQRLLTATEHDNPMLELQRITALILGHQAVVFNPEQSTHTTSVHQSVSASALRLIQSYGSFLQLEAKIEEIKAYVNALPNTDKNEAAKRCIEHITSPDYSFTDTSGVSTRQLLALAYIAIHDAAKRLGALADAKELFLEALYEIQRGYNLDNEGQDRGGVDAPICTAGTFNKLMEKLNGIHLDVGVFYITHEVASTKFPKLAQDHANAYLRTLASPQTVVDYQSVKDLLESIEREGSLEPIWSKIQESVRAFLWAEFGEAYANNINDARFMAMINNGQYLNSPGLDEIEAQLIASPGNKTYLAQQVQSSLRHQGFFLSFEKKSLWANRHANAQEQHAFDRQYGLILAP